MGMTVETETTVSNGVGDAAAADGKPKPDATPTPDREPYCAPSDVYGPMTDVLQKIQAHRDRPLFVMASDEIKDQDCAIVYSWRNELRRTGTAGPIDILIHSPGGVLTSCYRIARLFSLYSTSWTALVPQLAASGATLICLGSANMVMSDFAQLGPLDPQVVSRREQRFFSTERQSPLEAFQAVKYLREFALTSMDANMHFLLRKGVAPQTALRTARSVSTRLVSPILDKIDPYDLGSFALDSSLAVQYCQRICEPDDEAAHAQEDVEYTKLVEDYPAHEFVIDRAEAQNLGFRIEEPDIELEELFSKAGDGLKKVQRYLGFVPRDRKEESHGR